MTSLRSVGFQRLLVAILLFVLLSCASKQEATEFGEGDLKTLIKSDRAKFAKILTAGAESDFEKTKVVIKWLAENYNWMGTDYEIRNVDQIIQRGGGNCNELAIVAGNLLDTLGIRKRKVMEINLLFCYRFFVALGPRSFLRSANLR